MTLEQRLMVSDRRSLILYEATSYDVLLSSPSRLHPDVTEVFIVTARPRVWIPVWPGWANCCWWVLVPHLLHKINPNLSSLRRQLEQNFTSPTRLDRSWTCVPDICWLMFFCLYRLRTINHLSGTYATKPVLPLVSQVIMYHYCCQNTDNTSRFGEVTL